MAGDGKRRDGLEVDVVAVAEKPPSACGMDVLDHPRLPCERSSDSNAGSAGPSAGLVGIWCPPLP